ncbi:MAG TPA: hypothetical protein VEV82_03920, partial [Actinomycetota bacterium]|nr:hypothetical protein [Actinomycetota bacterium]
PETDPFATGLLGRIERLERRIGIEVQAQDAPVSPTVPPEAAAPTRAPVPRGSSRRSAGAEVSPAPATQPVKEPAAPAPAAQPVKEPAAPAPAAPAASEVKPHSEPPQTEVPPPTGGSSPEIGLAHVKDAWAATMKEVNKVSKRVWGLLSPSRPLAFDGSTLQVEVQSDFHQSSMSEVRNMEVLQAALHAALGIKATLDFVSRGTAPSHQQSPDDEADDASSAAPAGDVQDPVELVKKGLSAEVIEEKPHS